MPGSLENAQPHFADVDLVAVSYGPMRKSRACLFPENDFSPGARGQLPMAADKISVQVSLDHILDPQPSRLGFLDVLIDVALRIDNSSVAFRADQIRSVRQTAEIELLEVQNAFSLEFEECDRAVGAEYPRPFRTVQRSMLS